MKIPTPDNIEAAKRIRDRMVWKHIDAVIEHEFTRLRENKSRPDVAYKVMLLDKLYGCNRYSAWEIAESLIEAKIHEKLDENPVELVKQIAGLAIKHRNGKKTRLGPVFASKYCHFHRPDRFAIYDTYARNAIADLQGRKPRDYQDYKAGVDKLVNALNLTYKRADEYLWLYGQWLHYVHKTGREELSSEIRDNIAQHKQLFTRLVPPESGRFP